MLIVDLPGSGEAGAADDLREPAAGQRFTPREGAYKTVESGGPRSVKMSSIKRVSGMKRPPSA